MKLYVFKFRPCSHSEDYTIIATYKDEEAARKVKAALFKMLEDMKKNPDDYDVDWGPEDASVSSAGEKVYFEVYTAGYLEQIEALLEKVAKPVESIECYQNYQELEISVKVPIDLTPEAAMLILSKEEAEAVKWLIDECGRPEIRDCGDGKHQFFKWFYRGDEIYSDGVLQVGFEFPVDELENWTVE